MGLKADCGETIGMGPGSVLNAQRRSCPSFRGPRRRWSDDAERPTVKLVLHEERHGTLQESSMRYLVHLGWSLGRGKGEGKAIASSQGCLNVSAADPAHRLRHPGIPSGEAAAGRHDLFRGVRTRRLAGSVQSSPVRSRQLPRVPCPTAGRECQGTDPQCLRREPRIDRLGGFGRQPVPA